MARSLAQNFRATVRDTRPLTLAVRGSSELINSLIDFFVSYFAGTALEWGGPTVLPYDKIFSEVHKVPDYLYVPEETLFKTDLLARHKPLSSVRDRTAGTFYLFAGYLPDQRDVLEISAEEQEQFLSLLRQQYPALVKPYQEYLGTAQASLAVVPETSANRVGCGVLALSAGQSSGRSNRVFKLDLSVRKGVSLADVDSSIKSIELLRENPWGVFHTSNEHYILGVAKQLNGPLINGANGEIDVPLEPRVRLWLYACDDGGNRPGTVYNARLRIGKSQWVVTPAVSARQ